jgi:hypothetical protein
MAHAPSDNRAVQHESSDVDIRAIFGFGIALAALAVAIHVLVWLLFLYFTTRAAANLGTEHPLAAGQELRLPPEPRLQVTPRQDLQELRARDDEILNSYQWVDRTAGIVRIPIDEAMKLTVQRGVPVRQPPEQKKQ